MSSSRVFLALLLCTAMTPDALGQLFVAPTGDDGIKCSNVERPLGPPRPGLAA